jgi:1-acyl-sn-glycerol-3-phosphate acyltransferase
VECEGHQRLENLGAAIIVVNHCSNFDIYALLVALRIPYRFVAKASLFRIPIFGWALRVARFVPVEREHRERAIASLRRVETTLQRGDSVIFFPEGTRSRTGRLQKLKKGAFITAIRAGVPVVPVAIHGSHRIQPKGSMAVRPGRLKVVVGRPVSTRDMDTSDRDRLLSLVRDNLLEVLDPSQHPTAA